MIRSTLILACVLLASCGTSQPDHYSQTSSWNAVAYQDWRDEDPGFRLAPGDAIEVTVHTAPELNRTVTIGPDGRVNLPLAGPVMVAGRTDAEAASAVADAYTAMLRDPIVEVNVDGYGPQNILVGGQVNSPGMYEMPSRIGALEAVMLAGGFQDDAARGEIVILRRARNGGVMMRVVNLRDTLRGNASGDPIPLSRHDIVFVPRTTVSEVTLWVEQYVYGILPLDQAFSYAIANAINNR